MARTDNAYGLPPDLPIPTDDGACDHLRELRMPSVPLPSTSGGAIDLAGSVGRTVVFCYPATGKPNESSPPGWDQIPGARGCTPQSCAFRDHYQELLALHVGVYGLSTQTTADQREAVKRLHLPYDVLSDATLAFVRALRLPTFAVEGKTYIKRLTLVVRHGRVEHVFYPVFPPDRNAADVIAWLSQHPQPA